MRKAYLLAVLTAFLAGFVFSAVRMENRLENESVILLRLAPIDPRALLMGDYMALEYTVNRDIRLALSEEKNRTSSGRAVMRLTPLEGDDTPAPSVALFVRIDDGTGLGEGEFFLDFKVRGYRIITASPSFYFQEGHAPAYERARFGRFKTDGRGGTLLVALCDAQGQDIRPDF